MLPDTLQLYTVKAAFAVRARSADEAMDELDSILESKHITDDYYIITATKTPKKDLPRSRT